MNRRSAISALAGAAVASGSGIAQTKSKVNPRPAICAYSGNFAKIPYQELSGFVKTMGYDGLDLTVMRGGHIDPALYMVDLDRAFQTVQSDGLELPMLTTDFTSPSQTYAYAILYVAGQLGAHFVRLGTWPPAPSGPDLNGQNAAIRTVTARNELAQFGVTAAHCKVTALIANHAGSYPGRSIPEMEGLLAGVDRTAVAYCFDPAQAIRESHSVDAWESALAAALPRLGAVAVSDVALDKDTGEVTPCALGDGVIDWKKLFGLLAAARFHGPISLHMDYKSTNDVASMAKDLALTRGLVDAAWPI